MSYLSPVQRNHRWFGLSLVVVGHLAMGYLVISGLAVRAVTELQTAVMVALIADQPSAAPPAVVPPKLLPALPPTQPPKLQPKPRPVEQAPTPLPAVTPAAEAITTVTSAVAEPNRPGARPAAESSATSPPMPVPRTAAVIDARACVKPEYPSASLRAQEEGVVVVEFLVGIDGAVIESKVDKSSGFRRLDEAARRALSLCRFKPGTEAGQPVQSRARIEYQWRIEG